MNPIFKQPISEVGYNFIPKEFLPKGKDEYYLRNEQNRSGIKYRRTTALEIEILIRNRNTSDNWDNVLASDAFNPELVKNCKFFGLVRIGKLEPICLDFHSVRQPVGLYNSVIISCDLGDNVVIDNVHYLSHYIIQNEVIITNVHEMCTTHFAKFGNGILKQGEEENIRVWLEVCNENAGRKIIPFNGMLPGDAWLWSRHRDNQKFQEKLKQFTDMKFDPRRGCYGTVGDRTVIKNCAIIKDVRIGSHAYLKDATKLKNLPIHSTADAGSQVGEGCELVNGIVSEGCRIFYGVKAVRFCMASHSQLKYGARLINSYLGNNATISCCEVLNSLIFPGHEQHHNNSFLCAATLMGQSNVAAGATLGSNHNSRSADGEFIAGRGFWPSLCVSVKHNSKLASYALLAKGDYPYELNIPIPFSLISNDAANNRLVIMPGYWFMHNMYALARNAWKYLDRDKRIEKTQYIEYDFLAPDTVNEILDSLPLLELWTGKALLRQKGVAKFTAERCRETGRAALATNDEMKELEIEAEGFEHSKRKIVLTKAPRSYRLFRELIVFYAMENLLGVFKESRPKSFDEWMSLVPQNQKRTAWANVGGQLMEEAALKNLKEKIVTGKIKSWDAVHRFYQQQGKDYGRQKLKHAMAALCEQSGTKRLTPKSLKLFLKQYIAVKEWMAKGIYESRAKDYANPFRRMAYETEEEMEAVVGALRENAFILQQKNELKTAKELVRKITKELMANS